MDKKKIQALVFKSYAGRNLNSKKTKLIASMLNRKDLKKFISQLKNEENKRTVTIMLSGKNTSNEAIFSRMFPNKQIVYKIDPSLIAGIKIIDNDRVFEFDLKNTFEELVNHIKESYD